MLHERPAPYVAAAPASLGAPLAEHELTALWLLGRVPAAALPWPLLRAGRAGQGPGPDVREAAFLLPEGVVRSGAVEVHLRASDFVRHGHAADPAYASVVLHLVWADDRPAAGTPTPLPGGGAAATVALGPALRHDPERLRALLRRGPSGSEPCAAAAAMTGADATTARVRHEGQRRLAERSWRAARLVEERGWEAAWRELLDRALRASAGRCRETDGRREALAAQVTLALHGPDSEDADSEGADPEDTDPEDTDPEDTDTQDTGMQDAEGEHPGRARARGDPLAGLARLAAAGSPRALIEALRAPRAAGGFALGQARAAEIGWNAALPLLVTLAAAYDDVALARQTSTLAAAWPAPRPYGRTRALGALLGKPAPGAGALYAQGLLHLQELWCERGGCGVCPLSAGQ